MRRSPAPGLAALGGTLGAGAIIALPDDTCPLGETAQVAAWLATESTGQCGPCKRGLPEAAEALALLATGAAKPAILEDARRALGAAQAGGACSHPDGTARFLLTALDVFSEDVDAHLSGPGCGLPVRAHRPPAKGARLRWTGPAAPAMVGAVLAPDLIRLGPHGYPTSATIPVAPWQEHDARRAVNQCPALAVRLLSRVTPLSGQAPAPTCRAGQASRNRVDAVQGEGTSTAGGRCEPDQPYGDEDPQSDLRLSDIRPDATHRGSPPGPRTCRRPHELVPVVGDDIHARRRQGRDRATGRRRMAAWSSCVPGAILPSTRRPCCRRAAAATVV